jgi:hypothetical protein
MTKLYKTASATASRAQKELADATGMPDVRVTLSIPSSPFIPSSWAGWFWYALSETHLTWGSDSTSATLITARAFEDAVRQAARDAVDSGVISQKSLDGVCRQIRSVDKRFGVVGFIYIDLEQ